MHSYERESRLNSAFELLLALKRCGCPQRLVAAYLRVSHSTLSLWKRAKEDPARKYGVPTQEQLDRLVGLLRYQLHQNLGVAITCYDGCGKARREGVLLLHAFGSVLKEATQWHAHRQADHDDLVAKTNLFVAEIGREAARTMLRPMSQFSLDLHQGSTEAEWEDARSQRAAEADAALAAIEVTEADMARAKQDLDAWIDLQRQRLREKTLQELRQKDVQATPSPD